MTITERLMKPGEFSITLKPTTPNDILELIENAIGWAGTTANYQSTDGHILITKQRRKGLTASSAASIRYVGFLTDYETPQVRQPKTPTRGPRRIAGEPPRAPEFADNPTRTDPPVRISGVGLSAWLGTGGLPAWTKQTADTKTSATLSTWVTSLLDTEGNGIAAGTVTNTGTTYTGKWQWSTPAEMLDTVCPAVGAEWRVNNRLPPTLDAAAPATLFVDTPTLIVLREALGEGASSVRGVRGHVTDLKITARERCTRALIVGDGEGATTNTLAVNASGTPVYGPTGAAARRTKVVDAPNESDSTARTNLANDTLARYSIPRFEFKVKVEQDRFRDLAEPGDNIYVYDPPTIRDASATTVMIRGRPTWPMKVRIQRITWNLTPSYGVYLVTNNGSEVITDLWDHVEFEDPGATLEIGTAQGVGDVSFASGQGRFHPAAFERLRR